MRVGSAHMEGLTGVRDGIHAIVNLLGNGRMCFHVVSCARWGVTLHSAKVNQRMISALFDVRSVKCYW